MEAFRGLLALAFGFAAAFFGVEGLAATDFLEAVSFLAVSFLGAASFFAVSLGAGSFSFSFLLVALVVVVGFCSGVLVSCDGADVRG